MKKLLIPGLLLSLALLLSCTAERRLQRLIRNNPQLVHVDTIRVSLDTMLPEIPFQFPDIETLGDQQQGRDTNFYFPAGFFYHDTAILQNDDVLIRLVRKPKRNINDLVGGQALEVSGIIKPRPVNMSQNVPTQRITVENNSTWDKVFNIGIIIIAFLGLLLLYRFLFR